MPGEIVEVDQPAGEHQAPGRGIDQHRLALAQVLFPVRVAELVADQLVGGLLVGDPQQGLGHAHQQYALLAAQVVLAHEGLDRALVLGAGADPAHQVGGQGVHFGLAARILPRLLQQFAHMAGLVAQPGCGDRRAQGRGGGRGGIEDPDRAGGAGLAGGRGLRGWGRGHGGGRRERCGGGDGIRCGHPGARRGEAATAGRPGRHHRASGRPMLVRFRQPRWPDRHKSSGRPVWAGLSGAGPGASHLLQINASCRWAWSTLTIHGVSACHKRRSAT